MNYIRRHSFVFFSIVLFLYILVQTRSSYMGPIVTIILMFATAFIYKTRTNGVLWGWMLIMYIYLIIGMMNANRFEHIREDMVAFFPFVFMIAGNLRFRQDFLAHQMNGFRKLLPIAFVLYFAIFYYMGFSFWGSDLARFDYDEETHLKLTSPIAPLFFAQYIICYYNSKETTWKQNLWLIGVLILFLHFAVITQTKSIALPIIVVLALRLILNRNFSSRLKYTLIIVVLGFTLMQIGTDFFSTSMDSFINKFDENNESNTSRIEETTRYLRQCNVLQLAIGKGFGGIKTFHGEAYIGGVSMIHLGFGYLIMKGGFILLFLMYFPLISIIVRDFLARKYDYVLIASCLLMQDLGHEIWQSFLTVSVYWLLVYYRFYCRDWHNKLLLFEAR